MDSGARRPPSENHVATPVHMVRMAMAASFTAAPWKPPARTPAARRPRAAGQRPHRAAVIAARAEERGRRAEDARGGGPFRSGGDEGGAHTYLTFVRHAIHGGPTVKAARGGRRDPLRCGRSNAAAGGRSWRC